MRLPIFRGEKRYRRHMVTFGGLNLMQSFSDGEMRDCSGISHISFPAITQRQKANSIFSCESPSALIFAGKECIAASGALYYDRKKVGELSEGTDKQLAYMGSKVLVFPDKVYYDTKTEKFGSLQAECVISGVEVSFSKNSITVPSSHYVTTTKVEQHTFFPDELLITYSGVTEQNGKYVFNGFGFKKPQELTVDTIFSEKCNSNQYRTVMSVEEGEDLKSYIVTSKLMTLENSMKNIFAEFKVNDVVEISGCRTNSNNKSAALVQRGSTVLTFAADTFTETKETADITIKRKIPDFTSVCSYENRLWGCMENTIYASALGDPFNFFRYNGLSTDSFSVESNTSGDFTACVAYGNSCLFFKENACYKLYGNRPSNFQLTESFGSGIAKSEKKSIAYVNGKILYNGNGGVFVFYGGIPQCVSQKIEGITLKNTIGGSDGKRYYLSTQTEDGRIELVYDTELGLWSKSGAQDVTAYAYLGGAMYRLTSGGVEEIQNEADEDAEWEITLCPFDESYYKTKNYSRIHICAQLFNDSWICVEVKSDNGVWREISTQYGNEKRYINVPVIIRGCHNMQIRLSGKGKSIIESITREFCVS